MTAEPTPGVQAVLARLSRVRSNGSGWTALCPSHDDHTPSLSVGEGSDGRVLVKCHAGCDHVTILTALGLDRAVLMPPTTARTTATPSTIVATYDYRDVAGTLVYQTVRYAPKDFRQRRPDGHGSWIWSLDGVAPLCYRLPELADKPLVAIVEGEADADTLAALGLPATTNHGGAGKFRRCHADQVRTAGVGRCIILPDHDEPGKAHAQIVRRELAAAGVPSVILELPDLGPKQDVSDWLNKGHTFAELLTLGDAALTRPDASAPEPAAGPSLFRTAAELAQETPEHPEWIAEPFLARGALTELDAKPKRGKTTLILAGFVRGVLTRLPFLGTPTAYVPCVYLTEERRPTFRAALERAGLLAREDLSVLSYFDAAGVPWPNVVDLVRAECRRIGAGLVVVDTLSKWARLRDDSENQAGTAEAALEPLQQLAHDLNVAILVARHERKSGGEVGDSARGSNAFTGGVDVVLQLAIPQGQVRPTIRVLIAVSRFTATPPSLVIDRIHVSASPVNEVQAEHFSLLGTDRTVAGAEAADALTRDLPRTASEAVTLADFLASHRSLSRTVVQAALNNDPLIQRIGKGKRGDPQRFFRTLLLLPETQFTEWQQGRNDADPSNLRQRASGEDGRETVAEG